MRRVGVIKRFREFLAQPRTLTELMSFVRTNYDPEWLVVRCRRRLRESDAAYHDIEALVRLGEVMQAKQLLLDVKRYITDGTLLEGTGDSGLPIWQWLKTPATNGQRTDPSRQRCLYAMRRAGGLCTRCSDPAIKGQSMCEACAARHRQTVAESSRRKKGAT